MHTSLLSPFAGQLFSVLISQNLTLCSLCPMALVLLFGLLSHSFTVRNLNNVSIHWICCSLFKTCCIKFLHSPNKSQTFSPWLVWCGSVDWAQVCQLKGHRFNSQSGHMPGLQARSPVRGMWEATNQCIFHELIFPIPLPFPSLWK